MSEPKPFTAEEIDALRRWHRKRQHSEACLQGDPWPCRTARFLVTFDARKPWGPSEIAAWYSEWNDRLVSESGGPKS